eukprot:6193378-Amphidinium_carterae.1
MPVLERFEHGQCSTRGDSYAGCKPKPPRKNQTWKKLSETTGGSTVYQQNGTFCRKSWILNCLNFNKNDRNRKLQKLSKFWGLS